MPGRSQSKSRSAGESTRSARRRLSDPRAGVQSPWKVTYADGQLVKLRAAQHAVLDPGDQLAGDPVPPAARAQQQRDQRARESAAAVDPAEQADGLLVSDALAHPTGIAAGVGAARRNARRRPAPRWQGGGRPRSASLQPTPATTAWTGDRPPQGCRATVRVSASDEVRRGEPAVSAGQRIQRTLSVAVRAMRRPDACVHGHMADRSDHGTLPDSICAGQRQCNCA